MLGENRKTKGSGKVILENTVNTRVKLLAGIDAGSTETRVCLANAADAEIFSDADRIEEALEAISKQYCIPSTYATVEDAREISPASDNLEDNYDSTISLVSNKAEKPMVTRCRVLRGRKIQDTMGVTSRYLDSSTSKAFNSIFYTNIIDALGYAIMEKYNGKIPTHISLYLTLSVRPKELNSRCKQVMIENLVGQYLFVWKSVHLTIEILGLNFTTEPEAEISGTTVIYDLRAANSIDVDKNTRMADRLADSACFIHIEGGGSSIGVEVLRDGVILDACSSTFPLGGNYMSQVFIDVYREQSGRTITKEAANNALITCTLRDGKNILDVSELVAQCKNRVAMTIAERLRHEVIDTMSDLTMHDVEFISLGGRLFMADESGCTIGEYFSQYIAQMSPNTEVFSLPENFIAQGNLIRELNSDYIMEFLQQEFPLMRAAYVPEEEEND